MTKIVLSLLLLLAPFLSAQKDDLSLKVFFEPMNSAGWQMFFMADAMSEKNSAIKTEFYPVIFKKDGAWFSQRGDVEINEAARIVAVKEKFPGKIRAYLLGRSLSPWADGWKEACVYADINPKELDEAIKSSKEALLQKALNDLNKAEVQENAFFINSNRYSGENNVVAVIKEINKILPESKRMPAYEAELSKFKSPSLKVIISNQSKNFSTVNVTAVFKRYIPSIKTETVNVDENKKEDFSFVKYFPAYLIEDEPLVRESLSQAINSGLFEKSGKYFVYYDRNGSMVLKNEKKIPNKLELYVMSQCPFGVMAENAVIESFKKGLIKKDTKIEIHYIAELKKSEKDVLDFDSLHGAPEWIENARQLYIKNRYPEKFFSYILERNKDYKSEDWKSAAKAVGIDALEIEKNFETAKRLLKEDIKKANALSIGTSPTFIVDGNVLVVGLGELKKMDGYKDISSPSSAPSGGCEK